MGILGWIVVGLVAGALAKAIIPGRDPGGIIVTILIGIAGGLVGGFVGSRMFGVDTAGFFDIQTWIVSLVGAIVLLVVYRAVTGRRSRSRR